MRNHWTILIASAAFLTGTLDASGAELLGDPTRPYFEPPVGASQTTFLKVSAIFISKDRRVAIVNGQRVVVGDQIGGASVVEILSDKLRFDFQGKEITAGLRK